MNRSDDKRIILEFPRRLRMPMHSVLSGRTVTPEMVRAFYDETLFQRALEKAASQFMNFGYWYCGTRDLSVAQSNLMEKIISGIVNRSGRILDVACGTGATTLHIKKYWNLDRVFGINISEKQLSVCLSNSGCRNFAVMDAGAIGFADGSFDNVICVEAAFHFRTREAFLRDCVRMLTKGGVLALSDILWHPRGHELMPTWLPENFVATLSEYRILFLNAGFSSVEVIDITEEGWKSYVRHQFSTVHENWMCGRCDFMDLQNNLIGLYRIESALKYNLICFATK